MGGKTNIIQTRVHNIRPQEEKEIAKFNMNFEILKLWSFPIPPSSGRNICMCIQCTRKLSKSPRLEVMRGVSKINQFPLSWTHNKLNKTKCQ